VLTDAATTVPVNGPLMSKVCKKFNRAGSLQCLFIGKIGNDSGRTYLGSLGSEKLIAFMLPKEPRKGDPLLLRLTFVTRM